ncbi:uncharacterized protein LOC135845984 [Planococcus citri]|uniref:uncharacterized protein LOC135845984 n=1 Tax=Planococcus citri TaxID=170843 RepID=UPI0031F74073
MPLIHMIRYPFLKRCSPLGMNMNFRFVHSSILNNKYTKLVPENLTTPSTEEYENAFKKLKFTYKDIISSHPDVMTLLRNFAICQVDHQHSNDALVEAQINLASKEAYHIAYESVCRFRSIEEELQNIFFPPILQLANLSRFRKWIIALHFNISPSARALREVLQKSDVGIYDFAYMICELCLKVPTIHSHKQIRSRTPESDEEWDILFKLLEVRREHEKKCVKIIFDSLTLAPSSSENHERVRKYFILMKCHRYRYGYSPSETDVRKIFDAMEDIETYNTHEIYKDCFDKPNPKKNPQRIIVSIVDHKRWMSPEELRNELNNKFKEPSYGRTFTALQVQLLSAY